VFEVEVTLDSTDERLKPGMSAKADIIIDVYEDVLSVPLEAVFERDDTTIVYTEGGKTIPVSLGARNDFGVIVTDGLEEGMEIALVDPTHEPDELESRPAEEQPGRRKKGTTTTTTKTVIVGG
jgi:multidrug efflux pump subunit AcrA (membrane-fusion protein)